MTTSVRVACCALAGIVSLTAALMQAQAGPPLAQPRRDSSPPLMVPKAPSPPPSSRAPAPARASFTVADPAPVAIAPRSGASVDSVRPVTDLNPEAPKTGLIVRRPPPPVSSPAPAAARAVDSPAAFRSNDPPDGATALCKDGTWLFGAVPVVPCQSNGGLVVRLPEPKPVPRPPRPPQPPH